MKVNKNDTLLKLIDGEIVDISTDEQYYNGCPTCDYGSKYINSFDIELTKYKVSAEVIQMYEYRFSIGNLMKLILPNVENIMKMTEVEFIKWFENYLNKSDNDSLDSLRNFTVKYNVFDRDSGQQIDKHILFKAIDKCSDGFMRQITYKVGE